MDCSSSRTMTLIAGAAQRRWTQLVLRRIWNRVQSVFTAKLKEVAEFNAEERMRQKLRR